MKKQLSLFMAIGIATNSFCLNTPSFHQILDELLVPATIVGGQKAVVSIVSSEIVEAYKLFRAALFSRFVNEYSTLSPAERDELKSKIFEALEKVGQIPSFEQRKYFCNQLSAELDKLNEASKRNNRYSAVALIGIGATGVLIANALLGDKIEALFETLFKGSPQSSSRNLVNLNDVD